MFDVELQPYFSATDLVGAMANISVKNPGFSIPFLYEDQSAAHTRYDDNPAVIRAIVEGFDIPSAPVQK